MPCPREGTSQGFLRSTCGTPPTSATRLCALSWPLPEKVRDLQLPVGHTHMGRLFSGKACCVLMTHVVPCLPIWTAQLQWWTWAWEDAVAASRRDLLTLCLHLCSVRGADPRAAAQCRDGRTGDYHSAADSGHCGRWGLLPGSFWRGRIHLPTSHQLQVPPRAVMSQSIWLRHSAPSASEG